MKIFVCVKHVPDTAAVIKVEGDFAYEDADTKFIANPYDEFGVEEALSLVEEHGGEVVVITVAQPTAVTTIRGALAMGADRAVLVTTDQQFLDSSLTAKALQAVIDADGPPDLIFTGKGSIDSEGFQTQYRLARGLGIPVVNDVSALTVEGNKVRAQRESGGGKKQLLEMTLPCVIGAAKGLNEPRYPTFPNMMKAKKKEIKKIELANLNIDLHKNKITFANLRATPERSGATMLQGSVDEQVTELVRILKENERVI